MVHGFGGELSFRLPVGVKRSYDDGAAAAAVALHPDMPKWEPSDRRRPTDLTSGRSKESALSLTAVRSVGRKDRPPPQPTDWLFGGKRFGRGPLHPTRMMTSQLDPRATKDENVNQYYHLSRKRDHYDLNVTYHAFQLTFSPQMIPFSLMAPFVI